jgi:Transposase DDE domain
MSTVFGDDLFSGPLVRSGGPRVELFATIQRRARPGSVPAETDEKATGAQESCHGARGGRGRLAARARLHHRAGAPRRGDRCEVLAAGRRRTPGAPSNDKALRRLADEPDDHAIGRSRGGLTTQGHVLVDGCGLPLVVALTPGQGGDSTALPQLLASLRVPRLGQGPPRSQPDALRGDEAYTARAHRAHLRSRSRPRSSRSRPPGSAIARTRAPPAGDRRLRRPRPQEPQRCRTRFQPAQELARPGHPARQTRTRLSRRRRPRAHPL